MTIGQQIAQARLDAGLSQSGLSEILGISSSYISKLENDGVKQPTYETLEKLEAALGRRFNVEADDVTPQDVPDLEREFTKDEPPKPRKAAGAKKAAPRPKTGMPSLQVQLAMPYQLAATALSGRMPATANALAAQAGPCAAAWDQFLLRYPKLREKIEQGAVAADIVNLIYAHVPIVQVAREEMAMIQAMQQGGQGYAGGVDAAA